MPLVREEDEEEGLFVIEQASQDFLEVCRAEYVGYQHRLRRDCEVLFTPSLLAGSVLPTVTKNIHYWLQHLHGA